MDSIGHKGNAPGLILFSGPSPNDTFTIRLIKQGGLYYCPSGTGLHNLPTTIASASAFCIATQMPPLPTQQPQWYVPVTKGCLAESKVWMLWLASPGKDQLNLMPGRILGIPPSFQYHQFHFIDWKEEARIQKQAANYSAEQTNESKRRFYMDFGFMRASMSQFGRPNKTQDQVVLSFDNFTSYLLTIDEALRHAWVFLTASKDPPVDIVKAFLEQFGHANGGLIWTDQGGELACLVEFCDMVLRNHNYTVKPTGMDSPSQNSAIKIYNDKLAICVRTLLYGAGLPAKYWSAVFNMQFISTIG